MKKSSNLLTRRTALKGIASAGALTLGGFAFASSATAEPTLSSSFTANQVSAANDEGDVSELFIEPTSTVSWKNMDQPVVAIKQDLEARLRTADGTIITQTPTNLTDAVANGWWPIYREMPLLFEANYNYPGVFEFEDLAAHYGVTGAHGISLELAGDGDYKATSGEYVYDMLPNASDDGVPSQDGDVIRIASETAPMHDYDSFAHGSERTSEFLEGDMFELVSNSAFPLVNGHYGIAGNTKDMDNEVDGEWKTIRVDLRLTTSLHTATNFLYGTNSQTSDLPLVMGNDSDVGYQFPNPNFIPRSEMQAHADEHPAIKVQTVTFDARVHNEKSNFENNTNTNGTMV